MTQTDKSESRMRSQRPYGLYLIMPWSLTMLCR